MSNSKPSRIIPLAAFVLFTLLFAFNAATADQGAVQLKSLTTDEKLFSATACVELPSIKIETVQSEMGGGIKLTISAKPDDMTEEEATRIIRQAANLEFPINWELPVHVY